MKNLILLPSSLRLGLVLVFVAAVATFGQSVSASLPPNLVPTERFLFYLHGGVVTVLGNNAVNQSVPEWGPYEYLNILDSLRNRGFNVISENRKEGVDDATYVAKLAAQVDTLLHVGVKPGDILIVGASAGSAIALRASATLKNNALTYAILGGCWPDTFKEYAGLALRGYFLSIIEKSDPHGTCSRIFAGRPPIKSYREIVLTTGLSHGFLYKGHRAWIDPLLDWFNAVN